MAFIEFKDVSFYYNEGEVVLDRFTLNIEEKEKEDNREINNGEAEKEYVIKCDKDTSLLTNTTDTVELYQGDEKFIFNVVGYLVEKDSEGNFTRYVYLIDSKDYDNQHILKYSKFKGSI